uniref:MYND-type domain-containing protein n=1 Tax=Parascaris univalens TaxID=6257 RepID=A0A915BIN3_PARUN
IEAMRGWMFVLENRNSFPLNYSMKLGDLSDDERRVFDLIQKNETDEAISLFASHKARVNCLDSNGMTPLDQACFKANKYLVEYLLDHNADPNSNEHAQGYTALMFAALSGQPQSAEICRMLLDAGAYAYRKNSIDKSASEMAAFVGQHECVSVINNYIGIDEVEKLIHPKGKNSDEIFPKEFCLLTHSVTKTHQIHPVKVIFFIHDNESLLSYRKKFLYVIDRLFERQLRCKESNEVMSLKLWLILFFVREALKFIDSNMDSGCSVPHLLHLFAKYLLKMESGDRVRPNLETLLRNAVHAFPYHQSLFFQMLVKAIAQTKFGDRPSAYEYIAQAFFGQRMAATTHFCAVCGAANSTKRCRGCKLPYCSVDCQKFDWSTHKKCCASIAETLREEADRMSNHFVEEIPIGDSDEKVAESIESSKSVTSSSADLGDVDVSGLSITEEVRP